MLRNLSDQPILLGKDVKQVHVRPTEPLAPPTQEYIPPAQQPVQIELPTLPKGKTIPPELVNSIDKLHHKFSTVFNKDLTQGYNGAAGPHTCRLNWAGETRPTSDQVRMVSYSHDLKQLHQAVCDDLTQQQVLGIPQHHNLAVQFVCPSFLRRKPKAKGKPNHLLTKDDVRLVVNFSPINDHLKNIPSVKTTPNDILV